MLEKLLDTIASYKVLMVGDSIMDEYHYVHPLGKASKESILATRFDAKESFAGGVWAAAEHVKGFCAQVDVYQGAKQTIKRRFVDRGYLRKLFEVHYERENNTPKFPDPAGYDLVIVTDFGHGCVTPEIIQKLTRDAKFLAVNAQSNSSNYGFNLITKYTRADYVVIDEPEAWLAAQDRDSSIETIIRKLGYPKIIVTQGPNGSTGWNGKDFWHLPSSATRIVDTMGAGDAFLAVTAPLAAAGASIDLLCEVGNAAGAIKCATVGHRTPVTKAALLAGLLESPHPAQAEHS